MLRDERGASEHTLQGVLAGGAGVCGVFERDAGGGGGDGGGGAYAYSGVYGDALDEGVDEGECGAGAGGDSELVQVGWRRRGWWRESGAAGEYAEAAEASAAGAEYGGGESGAGFYDAEGGTWKPMSQKRDMGHPAMR